MISLTDADVHLHVVAVVEVNVRQIVYVVDVERQHSRPDRTDWPPGGANEQPTTTTTTYIPTTYELIGNCVQSYGSKGVIWKKRTYEVSLATDGRMHEAPTVLLLLALT